MAKSNNKDKKKSLKASLLSDLELKSKEEIEGIAIPSEDDVLAAGGHFGHSLRRWHPAYKPFLYTKRKGIYIINVEKTVESFRNAIKNLIEFLKNKKKILIVGTKKQAQPLVKEFGEKYGIFYITKKWPAGLFTNFKQVKASIDRLLTYKEQYIKYKYSLTKKELLDLERKIQKLEKKYGGVVFMDTLPDLIIIIDTSFEKVALKEARLSKVPVLGIVDTNADPRLVEFPVLMNDDAIKSLQLFFYVLGRAFEKYGDASLKTVRTSFESHLKELEKEVDEAYGGQPTTELKAGEQEQAQESKVVRVVAYTPIEEVKELTPKMREALKAAGIQSREALERLTYEELVSIKGVGPRTARSILKRLKKS